MKILLINNDSMVAKLFEAIAKKIGLELIIQNEFKELQTQEDLLLFIDDGVMGKTLEFLKTQKHIFSVYLHKRNSPAMEGFNFCIKKPFLPTEILDITRPKLEEFGIIEKTFDDITKDDLGDIKVSKNSSKDFDLEDMPEFNLDDFDELLSDDATKDIQNQATPLDDDGLSDLIEVDNDDLGDLIEIQEPIKGLEESNNSSFGASEQTNLENLTQPPEENTQQEKSQEVLENEISNKEALNSLQEEFLEKIDSLEDEQNLEDFDLEKQSLSFGHDLDKELEEFGNIPEEFHSEISEETPTDSTNKDLEKDFEKNLGEEIFQEEDKQKNLEEQDEKLEAKELENENLESKEQSDLEEQNDFFEDFQDDNDLDFLEDKEENTDKDEPQNELEPKDSKSQTSKNKKRPKTTKKSKTSPKTKKKKDNLKAAKPSQTQEVAESTEPLVEITQDDFKDDTDVRILDKNQIDEVKKILEETKDSSMKQKSEIFDIQNISEEEILEALGLKSVSSSQPNKTDTKVTLEKQENQSKNFTFDNIHIDCKDEAQNNISLDKNIIEIIKNTPLVELKSIFDGMEMSINIKFSGNKNDKNG